MGQPGCNTTKPQSKNYYNTVKEPEKPRCDKCDQEGCENLGENKFCTGYYRADIFQLDN